MICSLVPGFFSNVFAAAVPVTISIDSYNAGTLKLSWSNDIPGVDAVNIYYNVPNNLNNSIAVPMSIQLAANATSADITGLRNDFICDIDIQFTNGGVVVGEGFLYFLPGMTFSVVAVNETVVDSDPDFIPPYSSTGGREIGTKPKLRLKWNMPKVNVNSTFVNAQDSYLHMQAQIERVYHQGRQLNPLKYRINISSNAADMSLTDAVIVDTSNSLAYVSGSEADTVQVGKTSDDMTLDLLGRASETDALPETGNGVLGHSEILPGSVYYMTIQMVFDTYTDAVIMDKGSTPMTGKPYVYTPIRFQLSKDDADNLYAKVYTVNQGSLQLPDLYYEVQVNTVDSEYGWDTKARIDPDYFKDSNGDFLEYGVIPIIGISPNNNLYYRIVATSSSSDSIKSQNLPYRMAQDKSRPPIPKSISIVRKVLTTSGGVKSTDVTFSWDKPSNWEEIKSNNDPAADVYFCIMLNVSQTEILDPPYPVLEEEDSTQPDGKKTYEYPAKYRLVRYINARSVWNGVGVDPSPDKDKIVENGNRLEYTIKGFELFKYTDANGNLLDYPASLPSSLKPDIGYPHHLLANTVYYMQMYTTKGAPGSEVGSSDRSVTTSFTTLAGLEKDVPLASNFMICADKGNTAEKQSDGSIVNTVKLQFDTVQSINWGDYDSTPQTTTDNKIYYDLYMSTSTEANTFTKIGSTEDVPATSNVIFEGGVGENIYVTATISKFDPTNPNNTDVIRSFGYGLSPNTTYYFKLQTRLKMDDSVPDNRTSKFTSILPITTKKGPMTEPDPKDRIPAAPTDFAIATDSSGNLLVTSSSVTFSWKRMESDVLYTLICTSERLSMNAGSTAYENDAVYQDFKNNFGFTGTGIVLDPNPVGLPAENFSYDPATKMCTYKIDKGLFPNRLYYFSLRAERKSAGGKTSAWISIPVTTLLIEAPTQLQAVNDPELGFYWYDSDTAIQPDDYKIYLKGPDDKAYKIMSRSQLTIIKDGRTYERSGDLCYLYYCRIFNLKNNSTYNVKVCKGADDATVVFENDAMYTKDGYHEIQVKWKGVSSFSYEVAVKAAADNTYTTLTASDFELYANASGETKPYYFEETNQTNTTEYGYFYTKIKSYPVTLSDGRIEHRTLKSNTKYQVKVRAVKTDTVEPDQIAYSKYIGPVDTRTEFDQSDYDDNEDGENNEISFLDKIKKLEERVFWRVGINSSSPDKVLLKGDRIINVINSGGSFPIVIDISSFNTVAANDVVFVPIGIAEALSRSNRNMTVKTYGVDYVLGPNTLDLESSSEITSIGGKTGVKDLALRLSSLCSDYPNTGYPSGTTRISKVAAMDLDVLGLNTTDDNLEKAINNKLYNTDTGLVKKKSGALGNIPDSVQKDKQKLSEYLDELVGDVEVDLSQYISYTLEGTNGTQGAIIASTPLQKFNSPMQIKLAYSGKAGYKLPYALYKGASAWQRISKNITDSNNYIGFYASGTGKYAILMAAATTGDVASDYWAKSSIDKFTSKYDLSDVFSGIGQSFSPENSVSVKEAVLLYEKVLGKTNENVGMDIRQKAQKLQIDDVLNMNGIMKALNKQQLAVLVIRIYSKKSGIDAEKLDQSGNVYIKDETLIGDKYYKYVKTALDTGIMELNENSEFGPDELVTRAFTVDTFVKMLKLTGDI
jgi:S-layer homology domain.